MTYVWQVHTFLGTFLFIIGTVVGSFLNVCIYRLPLEKSVIWPDSRCPTCLGRIGFWQNWPILSWLFLGASCKTLAGARSPAGYPLVEGLVGLLFAAICRRTPTAHYGFRRLAGRPSAIIYLAVTLPLRVRGGPGGDRVRRLRLDDRPTRADELRHPLEAWPSGAIDPGIRPMPSTATTHLGGLAVGLTGAITGAGIVVAIRLVFGVIFRREAMGAGDIHILAVIGAVMGWQATVLTLFLSAFFGLIPAVAKLIPYAAKRLAGREWNASDREIPLGPFLSMAAVTLLLAWPRVWPRYLKPYFEAIAWLVRDLLGWGT